ncbi:MAG: hypothetical protein NDF55_06160 [archaeon GB-1867-005]|nr:hypothetical protein [Candidatus Culexmicrobium cathedralense]
MPLWLSICWWVTDAAWTFLVASSSLYNVWLLPIERTAALISGLVLLVIGSALTLDGIIEFRPIRRVFGMEVSILITTGVYSWSRNPQFLDFYLALLGISLLGRSGYALFLAAIAIICCHYYIVKAEEPYLERVFGKEYLAYKLRTPRYVRAPRSENKST